MHKRNMILAAVGLVFLTGVFGCSESAYLVERETLLDQNWGRAYEAAKFNQMLNPNAGMNHNPALGLDGVGADHSVIRYEDSFKERRDTETVNILKLQ